MNYMLISMGRNVLQRNTSLDNKDFSSEFTELEKKIKIILAK